MIDEKSLIALPRDVPNYHERQAAQLAESATTTSVKARLLKKAEEHKRLVGD
jgi:hypothetical protein